MLQCYGGPLDGALVPPPDTATVTLYARRATYDVGDTPVKYFEPAPGGLPCEYRQESGRLVYTGDERR